MWESHTMRKERCDNKRLRLGRWLRALAALQRTWCSSQHPHGSLHVSVTPVQGRLMPSHRHACNQNTSEHKIKINYIFLKKKRNAWNKFPASAYIQ